VAARPAFGGSGTKPGVAAHGLSRVRRGFGMEHPETASAPSTTRRDGERPPRSTERANNNAQGIGPAGGLHGVKDSSPFILPSTTAEQVAPPFAMLHSKTSKEPPREGSEACKGPPRGGPEAKRPAPHQGLGMPPVSGPLDTCKMHTGGGWKGSPGTARKSSHRTTGPSSEDGPTPATSTATCGDEEELPKNLLTTAIRCDDEQTLGVFTTTTAPARTTAQTPSTAIRPEGERPGAPLSKAHRTSAEVQCNKQTKPSAPAPAGTTAYAPGTALHPEGKRPDAPLSTGHRIPTRMRCRNRSRTLLPRLPTCPENDPTPTYAAGSRQSPPDLMAAAYEHTPRVALRTEHPSEHTPGSLRTEHPSEHTPGSLSGLRTEHPSEHTPGSLSGQRTEHTCELAPCSRPGHHNGHTSELAPCTEPGDHRWQEELEATRCRGAAGIEFWPQQTVYPLPTLEPRDDPAPQGEPTVAAQAELDLQLATFPELVRQYFAAPYQTGIYMGGTFPLPTLAPRYIFAPQEEPTIAVQAELDQIADAWQATLATKDELACPGVPIDTQAELPLNVWQATLPKIPGRKA